MKSYRNSILWSFYSSIVTTLISGLQLYLNIYYERFLFIYFFTIFTSGFLCYTLILSIDLLTKETKMMNVIVIEMDENIIKVLKPNGKKRRITTLNTENNKYQINEVLQLTLTKRTSQILEINLQVNSGSNSFV